MINKKNIINRIWRLLNNLIGKSNIKWYLDELNILNFKNSYLIKILFA